MKFDDLDKRMRVYESTHDLSVLPGLFMVARIDGRAFTRLTRELHTFEAPFDQRFRDYMVATTAHLMDCGFQALFAYTQSDEISVLLSPQDQTFGRKLRKLNSVLAGEASAQFTLQLGAPAVFDCRISELPSEHEVVEYFRWRHEDAARNALSAHCYWLLRKRGETPLHATKLLRGLSGADKNEMLFQAGINFNDLPNWQKRGIAIQWESFERDGHNPLTGASTTSTKRRLKVDYDLPIKDAFNQYIRDLLLTALPTP